MSAVRIVKEWPDYDNEIKRLQERVAGNKSESDEKATGMCSLQIILNVNWLKTMHSIY